MPNFDECAAIFRGNATLQSIYRWSGPLPGLNRGTAIPISLQGCLDICGHNPKYYRWEQISATITTWVLPVVGVLIQAPFESNAFWRTVLATARWIGSPILSLSYVLWNIKLSAKGAMMVDMAVKFDEAPSNESSFGSMRDAMYILLAMNQYTRKELIAFKQAEGLLRIVLFSRKLDLLQSRKTLQDARKDLAQNMRDFRRRGAVPVFVSTFWFLFAFGLSIQAAFSEMSLNTVAHDLALGCLLAWFPVLILACIVDKNPMAADVWRRKLNDLVNDVRLTLRDRRRREAFVNTFRDQPNFIELRNWVDDIAASSDDMDEIFVAFAGQARIRWHYGCAHPILFDIENRWVADEGRDWLANEQEARANLILGSANEGIVWRFRDFWQVAAAVAVVAGGCGGAFILSFVTPTVGLGCRSGGYTIFFTVSFGLLVAEMLVWLFTSPPKYEKRRWMQMARLNSESTRKMLRSIVAALMATALWPPWRAKEQAREQAQTTTDDVFNWWNHLSVQRICELFFFRPIEVFNATWLIYIVVAQTIGSNRSCNCITSTWSLGGGYLDMSQQSTIASEWVHSYWTAGTVLTSVTMGLSLIYIINEWCQQSWLSTSEYDKAMAGLRNVRWYRQQTYVFRLITRFADQLTFKQLEKLAKSAGLVRNPRKALLWKKAYKTVPVVREGVSHVTTKRRRTGHQPTPSIELTDYSSTSPYERPLHDERPHSPISGLPTSHIPRSRSRATSSSSLHLEPQDVLEFGVDDDMTSTRPLVRRSSAIHSRSDRSCHEVRCASNDVSPGSPALLPTDHVENTGLLNQAASKLQSRHGYRRKTSDPAALPEDLRDGVSLTASIEGRSHWDPSTPDERQGISSHDRDIELGYQH